MDILLMRAHLLSRFRSMFIPSRVAAPFVLFSVLVGYSVFLPWTEGRSVPGIDAPALLGNGSVGLHHWEGVVVLGLACATAITALMTTFGTSASSRSRVLLLNIWTLVTLVWFRVNVIGSPDPRARHFSGPPSWGLMGGTGWNLALVATIALIGCVAWWKVTVGQTASEARFDERRPRPVSRYDFLERRHSVLARPELVAMGAALVLIATTQAWTLRLMDSQRGLHSIAGALTAAAATTLIAVAGWRSFLRLGERAYFFVARTAATAALCGPLWTLLAVVGRHDRSADLLWNSNPYHVEAGFALYAAIACAACTLALLYWQGRSYAGIEHRLGRRGVLRWPIRVVPREDNRPRLSIRRSRI